MTVNLGLEDWPGVIKQRSRKAVEGAPGRGNVISKNVKTLTLGGPASMAIQSGDAVPGASG